MAVILVERQNIFWVLRRFLWQGWRKIELAATEHNGDPCSRKLRKPSIGLDVLHLRFLRFGSGVCDLMSIMYGEAFFMILRDGREIPDGFQAAARDFHSHPISWKQVETQHFDWV